MKVFINPGHAPNGIPDPGVIGNLLRESDVAAGVARAAAGYLIAAGVETEILQSDSLSEICAVANDSGADLFVSIHCNGFSSPEPSGTETWACAGSDAGHALAACIQRQIVDSMAMVDRGVKIATPGVNGLYVLTHTDMPAVLVELGFISNPYDATKLKSRLDDFARAIARGVTDYEQGVSGCADY